MTEINLTGIFIDTDIGTDIDDAYALAMAMRGGLRIAGISTVSGDTIKRGRIVKKMLALSGNDDVPVFAGMASRSVLTHDRWVPDSDILEVHHDFDEMIDHYWHVIEQQRVGRVQIVSIGPLSNIAAIRERDVNRFDDRAQLLMMGGSFHRGYLGIKIPMLEYNIVQDRAAAREILSSRMPVRIVPLDVTASLKLSLEDIAFLSSEARENMLVRGLIDMTNMFRSSLLGHRLPILFDPATIAPLLDPTILSFTRMAVEVTRGGFTRVPKASKPGVSEQEVCTSIDMARFYDLFFTTLTGKHRASREKPQHGAN